MDLEELDRFVFEDGSSRAFGSWLYAWKYRWLAGAPIRVLVARDSSHCIVVRDEDAPRPTYTPLDLQLALDFEEPD